MTRSLIALGAGVLASVVLAGPAAADPPVNTDGTGHVHHVMLGNGECLQLDSVSWDAVARGLHRGANASTSAHGPWHNPCP
ncbi:MAG: hypothetical protein M3237_15935 [Actinomycetota bacterium]|nr:hypothetical protein [Actinomycetota bacterium]